jgi:bifunctional DNA-binding transcriptional regulator/antitoxin component of YhaV-PrlF toxin-antitoxin module
MSNLQDSSHAIYKVSPRGQFSLPAAARRRWGIEHGGEVELFDLGSCVVMLPVGAGSARASIARALTADRYQNHVKSITDPDLRDE